MGFSWEQMKKQAVEIKIRRAITMASKKNVNPDFAIEHPDWVREAQKQNYTDLKAKVKQAVEKEQERAQARRDKLVRKT